jgi:large subunit ribosomal protein L44e
MTYFFSKRCFYEDSKEGKLLSKLQKPQFNSFRIKKKKSKELKWGQRQFRRVTSGYRGYPRPLPSGNKPTKKLDLRYKCKECNKSHIKRSTFRAGKVEFVQQ